MTKLHYPKKWSRRWIKLRSWERLKTKDIPGWIQDATYNKIMDIYDPDGENGSRVFTELLAFGFRFTGKRYYYIVQGADENDNGIIRKVWRSKRRS